jgi:hypothetical protein
MTARVPDTMWVSATVAGRLDAYRRLRQRQTAASGTPRSTGRKLPKK